MFQKTIKSENPSFWFLTLFVFFFSVIGEAQTRMRLANWWYQRKEYPIAVKCYKKALQYYNDIPTNQECSSPEEYKELLQLMEERLRVMRQVANIFKRIANFIQSGQIET